MSLFALIDAESKEKKGDFYTHAMHVYVTGLNWCFTDIPSMQCCAAIQATYRNEKHPYFEWRGGVGGVLLWSSEVILFEYDSQFRQRLWVKKFQPEFNFDL